MVSEEKNDELFDLLGSVAQQIFLNNGFFISATQNIIDSIIHYHFSPLRVLTPGDSPSQRLQNRADEFRIFYSAEDLFDLIEIEGLEPRRDQIFMRNDLLHRQILEI